MCHVLKFYKYLSTFAIDRIYLYCSHRGTEIVIYYFTVESLKCSVFQATGDGTEPIKEEISGQNQLSHTNQIHILRWRPTVGSFRCYFQSLHKGWRCLCVIIE